MSIASGIIARAEARRIEHAAQMTTKAPTSRRLATPGPVTTKEETVRRMADAMRDHAAAGGSVNEADLLARGWTAEAIRTYGAEAAALANRDAVRSAA